MPTWNPWRKLPSPSTPKGPLLPQEIIDQIIDEVAGQSYEEGKTPLLDSLKACALVSKSFHPRARRHIFSHIDFTVDKHGQQRAVRLLKILRHQSNDDLVRYIHTFGLYFNLPYIRAPLILRMVGLGHAFSSFIRAQQLTAGTLDRRNNIDDLLDTLSHNPIVHFSFGGQPHYTTQWTSHDKYLIRRALRIVMSPSLRTLRFSGLLFLPWTLVKNAFYSRGLKELVLCRVYHFTLGVPEDNDEARPPIAELERLELLGMKYSTVLSLLRTLTPNSSVGPERSPTFPEFSHLRTLAVTVAITPPEMDSLWEILLGVAPFLETLDVQHTGWLGNSVHLKLSLYPAKTHPRGADIPWPSSVCFSRLTSLRHLRFTASSSTSLLKQEPLSELLASATAPMLLQSVDINLYIQCRSPQEIDAALLPSYKWKTLDRALNTRALVDLKAVTCKVRPFLREFTSSSVVISSEALPQRIDPTFLLPRTASSPSVGVDFYLMPMSGPHVMFS